jgi:hypothetical protein
LIEKSAGEQYVGSFQAERAKAAHDEGMRKMRVRLDRKQRPRHERSGALVLPPEMIDDLRHRRLEVEDVAVFVTLMAQYESGEPFASKIPTNKDPRLEDGWLVVDSQRGRIAPAHLDERAVLVAWKKAVEWLAEQRWLALEQRGSTWRIGPGERWLSAVEARAGKPTTTKERSAA